jgi:hypothetical protein
MLRRADDFGNPNVWRWTMPLDRGAKSDLWFLLNIAKINHADFFIATEFVNEAGRRKAPREWTGL